MNVLGQLSRRERQIMEVIYARGEATATEIVETLPDPPSRTAVRTFLRILENKGHLRHKKQGREFVYSPTKQRGPAGKSALARVLDTFFNGSLEQAVAAHLLDRKTEITPDELERLSGLIRAARKKEAGS
jgi:predicted transcriptional regulator